MYLLNKKTKFIPSSEMNYPKSGIFILIIMVWVGQSNFAR